MERQAWHDQMDRSVLQSRMRGNKWMEEWIDKHDLSLLCCHLLQTGYTRTDRLSQTPNRLVSVPRGWVPCDSTYNVTWAIFVFLSNSCKTMHVESRGSGIVCTAVKPRIETLPEHSDLLRKLTRKTATKQHVLQNTMALNSYLGLALSKCSLTRYL